MAEYWCESLKNPEQAGTLGVIQLKIAEIVFSMTYDISYQSSFVDAGYESFLSTVSPDSRIRFIFKSAVNFRPRREDKLLADGSSSLYRSQEGFVLISGVPEAPHLVIFFRNDFRDVEAFFSSMYNNVDPAEVISDLPQYPPLRIALNCLIARRRGLLIHGCGIVDEDKGYLFTGHSNHGKSTMAKLWRNSGGVLGDELAALAIDREGRFRIYGTPWPGEYSKISYGGVSLRKIFFLSHSRKNTAKRVYGAEAGAMLLARSFAPTWDRTGMESTLDAVTALLRQVPCYDLGFFPDDSVVDFVRGL